MPRPAAPSDSRLARLRRYFGLSQQELAALLGVTPVVMNYLERGRRSPSPAVWERLAPFLAVMEAAPEPPTPLAAEAPNADPDTPPPGPIDPGPLERRRRACLFEARNLRWQLRQLPEQAAVAARWAEALPRLRAALPPPPPADEAPATAEAVRLRYVHSWLETVPLALEPEALALWHLRHQRARALEAEAAALGALLAISDELKK
jgi:transcriptional regulator with XRE-family HTH domain